MSRIEWDDSFSVNNAEIDNQHKKWITIHNNLHESILKRSENPQLGPEALKAMKEYAQVHFSFDEEYMQKINYTHLIEHHRIHKDFDNLIYNYYREAHEGKLVLDSKIIRILKNWLLDHILKEDKKYALFLEVEK